MNELLPFDSDLHSDLFKLMILASNGWDICIHGLVIDHWVSYYRFQFNDRSIAPVEYEGWMTIGKKIDWITDNCGCTWIDSKYTKSMDDQRIKFRFEEN